MADPYETSAASPIAVRYPILRWAVPLAYCVILIIYAAQGIQMTRRSAVAGTIAAHIASEQPKTLDELKLALRDYTLESFKHLESRGDQRWSIVRFSLAAPMLLHLTAILDFETETIEEMTLTFDGSDDVPIDAPEQDYPAPALRPWLIFLTVAVSASWLWHRILSKPSPPGCLAMVALGVAFLPLVLFGPVSLVLLMRILP